MFFSVLGESIGVDGRVYYIIQDIDKKSYTLPKEYYAHYGLGKNSTFTGRYLRYKEGLGVNIEPLSPFFEPGLDYEFIIKELIELTDGMENVMVLRDKYGFDHKLSARDGMIVGQKLRYRVKKMRKGWPLLEEL